MSKMKQWIEELEEQLGLTPEELSWIDYGIAEIEAGRSTGPDGDYGAQVASKLRQRCIELLSRAEVSHLCRSYQPGCAHCDWKGPMVSSYGESKQLAAEHARECGDSALTARNAALDENLAAEMRARVAAEKALEAMRTEVRAALDANHPSRGRGMLIGRIRKALGES